MDEPKLDGVAGTFQEVGADLLEHFTSRGWRLVCLVRSSALLGVDTRTESLPSTYMGGSPSTHSNVHSHYGEQTRYLLRKDSDTAMEELTTALSQAVADTQAAKAARTEAEKQLAAAQEQAHRLTKRSQQLDESLAAAMLQRDQERASVRKMETDLGKLRKEIGEREWARILGTAQD